MSLSIVQSLRSLALGQALMVAPALGESYAGKTAATIAALLFVLAQGMEELPSRRLAMRQRLLALLGDANVADPALADDLGHILGGDDSGPWMARDAVLMGALTQVHAWADGNDPALARACREYLADWSASELLAPPTLPVPPA